MYNGCKILALCISKAGDERNFEFIDALNKAAVDSGFRLFIYHTCSDLYWKTRSEDGDKTVFELIDYDIVDVMVIFDEAFQDKSAVDRVAAEAERRGVPVISVGAVREGCASFVFKYEKGFEQVVRHVIEYHGAKNSCFIAGKKDELCSEQRIAAYKRVLADNGIAFRPDRLFYGDYWWGPTRAAVHDIIASGDIPQAVICANDMMAITVCEELKKYGYAVPDDVIVTGFDGTWSAISCVPPITTCKCSFTDAAAKIVKAADDIMGVADCAGQYNIDFEMNVYRSCGCQGKIPDFNMGDRLKSSEDRFIRYQDDERTLNEISERLIECESPSTLTVYLNSFGFDDTYIVLNNDCFDAKIDPSKNTRNCCFDDTMQVLYMSGAEMSRFPEPLNRRDILPDLEQIIAPGNPLVFSALSFLGIPMGYVCFSFESDIENYCKILQYVTALNNALGNYRLVRYLKYTAESMERMSKRDFMTGLCNRKGFYVQLPELVLEAGESDYIAVATVDIDGLKNINDKFGHEDGDFAIMSVSEAVTSLPFERKICGRFGGDELVICAVTDNENAEQVFKDRIKNYLDEVNGGSGKPFNVSASVGVFTAASGEFNFEYSLKQSDEKMYIMKIGRPNRRKN